MKSATVSAGGGLHRPIDLPAPSHIGIVVKDLAEASRYYTTTFGLGPWTELAYERFEWLVGDPASETPALRARTGAVTIELLQPVKGPSIWADFLESHGEGMHHLAYKVPNWEEVCSQMKERGAVMIAGGVVDGCGWAYFPTSPGGLIFEILDENLPV
jgi:methylmalonyl-CoA/ethylmalonyl-CoA epimerase